MHEDSIASFVVDAILIVVLGKFVLFPLIGMLMGSAFPVVAVVSGSMDHNDMGFESWWLANQEAYESYGMGGADFEQFPQNNGFEKGDVLVIKGISVNELKVGDVIVYSVVNRRDPIIHRIVSLDPIATKGDANLGQLSFESNITPQQIHGKAVVLVPYIGWVKVGAMELFGLL